MSKKIIILFSNLKAIVIFPEKLIFFYINVIKDSILNKLRKIVLLVLPILLFTVQLQIYMLLVLSLMNG